MTNQDFTSYDDVLEYAAALIEETDVTDLAGTWAKRKRAREDAELRYKTAQDVRKRCAAHIRAMKNRPDLGPIATLRGIANAEDGHLGHAMYLRDAWPLAWKGWVDIECILKTNSGCLPPETTYRIVLTDKGREALLSAGLEKGSAEWVRQKAENERRAQEARSRYAAERGLDPCTLKAKPTQIVP